MSEASVDVLGGNSQPHLKSIVARVERLNEDKAAIAEDIEEVMAEAKSAGFQPKIIRKVIAKRKAAADKAKYDEEQALIEMYCDAIGMGEL